jgi:hypothetical protein
MHRTHGICASQTVKKNRDQLFSFCASSESWSKSLPPSLFHQVSGTCIASSILTRNPRGTTSIGLGNKANHAPLRVPPLGSTVRRTSESVAVFEFDRCDDHNRAEDHLSATRRRPPKSEAPSTDPEVRRTVEPSRGNRTSKNHNHVLPIFLKDKLWKSFSVTTTAK